MSTALSRGAPPAGRDVPNHTVDEHSETDSQEMPHDLFLKPEMGTARCPPKVAHDEPLRERRGLNPAGDLVWRQRHALWPPHLRRCPPPLRRVLHPAAKQAGTAAPAAVSGGTLRGHAEGAGERECGAGGGCRQCGRACRLCYAPWLRRWIWQRQRRLVEARIASCRAQMSLSVRKILVGF